MVGKSARALYGKSDGRVASIASWQFIGFVVELDVVAPPAARERVMIKIVLDDEQAKAIENAIGPVELRDSSDTLVGYVARRPSDAEIQDAKRRLNSAGPWYSTEQVLNHLQSLEQG
jgi:hypothetical protein